MPSCSPWPLAVPWWSSSVSRPAPVDVSTQVSRQRLLERAVNHVFPQPFTVDTHATDHFPHRPIIYYLANDWLIARSFSFPGESHGSSPYFDSWPTLYTYIKAFRDSSNKFSSPLLRVHRPIKKMLVSVPSSLSTTPETILGHPVSNVPKGYFISRKILFIVVLNALTAMLYKFFQDMSWFMFETSLPSTNLFYVVCPRQSWVSNKTVNKVSTTCC